MKNRWQAKNKGQVLVIVTLMLIGLVAMLALVLDGGMNYTNRRAAQLAADAGALAGARAYCLADDDNPGAATIAAVTAADQYVALNDANLVNVSVEAGSGDVTVDTSITYDTFFLGILGRAQMTAPASATAGCTPPTKGFGVLPIAWSCRPPAGEEDPGTCDLEWIDENEDCDPGEDPIYIIIDSEKIEDEIVCGDPSETPPDGVTYVDCDFDDNDEDDLEPIIGGNKSWLNLDGGAGNANELMEWIEEGFEGEVFTHFWYSGTQGTVNSVYHMIEDELLNDIVVVPVFDQVCSEMPSDEEGSLCELLWHDQDEVIPGSENEDYFHIISFAKFRITCVDDGGGSECPAQEHLGLDKNLGVKSVEGCFVSGFDEGLGGGGGDVDTGTFIVYLKH
jgi:hypothetical protein